MENEMDKEKETEMQRMYRISMSNYALLEQIKQNFQKLEEHLNTLNFTGRLLDIKDLLFYRSRLTKLLEVELQKPKRSFYNESKELEALEERIKKELITKVKP